MGNSMPFSKYASGFAEVADKTKWKVGLIVNVCGCGEVVVKSIRGLKMGPPSGTLTVGEDINRIFHYYYSGDQIIIDDSARYDIYEIMLVEKHISDANPGCSWGGDENIAGCSIAIGGCENCKHTSCEHCTGGCDCATGGCPFCGKHKEEIVI